METTDLLTVILGGISTILTFVTGYLGFIIKKRDSKTSKYEVTNKATEDLISRLQFEIERISKERGDLVKRIEESNKRIAELEKKDIHKTHRMMLLESAHNDKPFPEWLKDIDGTMLSLNPMYERHFLIPQGLRNYDYIGSDDSAAWSEDSVDQYRKNDEDALLSRKKYIFTTEHLYGQNGEDMGEWLVIKFVRESNGIKIGVGGQCFPLQDVYNLSNKILNQE